MVDSRGKLTPSGLRPTHPPTHLELQSLALLGCQHQDLLVHEPQPLLKLELVVSVPHKHSLHAKALQASLEMHVAESHGMDLTGRSISKSRTPLLSQPYLLSSKVTA
jgi:hypothetical protein